MMAINGSNTLFALPVEIDQCLRCVIQDNGIGRRAAMKIKEAKHVKRGSMGMKITKERLQLLNEIYNTANSIEVEDLYDEAGQAAGTKVILFIPI